MSQGCVFLTRDSVCLADDIDAPHEQSFVFDAAPSVDEFMARLLEGDNLPSVTGIACWSLWSDRVLAVVETPSLRWDRLRGVQPVLTVGERLKLRYHWGRPLEEMLAAFENEERHCAKR